MNLLVAIAVATVITVGVYAVTPTLWPALRAALRKREGDCALALEEIHTALDPIRFYALMSIGPAFSIVVASTLWRHLVVMLSALVILLYATRNLHLYVIKYLQRRRLRRIKGQLVDALGMVASALRSGLSLQQGFQVVAEEIQPPLSQEFRYIVSAQQLGKSFDQALADFARRVPLDEVEMLVNSLAVLRESGGNVIETLEVIIGTIGEEQRVRDKIKTLTTQGIAQAVVISALPLFLAAALYLISPSYIAPLFEHPIGWALIAFMFLMQATGMLIMKKIVTIKV